LVAVPVTQVTKWEELTETALRLRKEN
jgi:hypothetical protein